MKESDIDLTKWNIIKSNIFDISSETDETFLIEDLFQISCDDFIIDAGWYEGINSYITYLIQHYDWDNPIIKVISKDKKKCLDAIAFCIKYTQC